MSDNQTIDNVETYSEETEADFEWSLLNQLRLLSKNSEDDHKILVVDDEPLIREEISEDLEMEGYTVVTAANGVEAIETIGKDHNIAVIIADIRMPEMDGIDMMREIQRLYGDRNIQVLVLTGHGGFDDAVEALRLGAFEFMTKPVKMEHLEHLLSKALELADFHRHEKNMKEFLATEVTRYASEVQRLENENQQLRLKLKQQSNKE